MGPDSNKMLELGFESLQTTNLVTVIDILYINLSMNHDYQAQAMYITDSLCLSG